MPKTNSAYIRKSIFSSNIVDYLWSYNISYPCWRTNADWTHIHVEIEWDTIIYTLTYIYPLPLCSIQIMSDIYKYILKTIYASIDPLTGDEYNGGYMSEFIFDLVYWELG